MIEFFVPGQPMPQPRPRWGRTRMYNPSTPALGGWKQSIALAATPHVPAEPYDEPVAVILAFTFRRPRNHFGTGRNAHKLKPQVTVWHDKGSGGNKRNATGERPGGGDGDNLTKPVWDVLTELGFWVDDARVAWWLGSKQYATVPGLSVRVHPFDEFRDGVKGILEALLDA